MKKILFIITFLCLVNCKTLLNPKEKFFDPKDLSKLSLENIVNFWEKDSLKYYSNYFKNYLDYIGGVGLRDDKKRVGVAVFVSGAKAIECMEGRINTVASVIKPGIHNEILKGTWWFTDGLSSCVFANQWNTIIEVYYTEVDYEEVKTLLIETASEIAKRVDSLSN